MSTKRKHYIAPSMMCANFLNLEEEIVLFETMDIPFLHIVIMDGHYVPNFTLGPDFCLHLAKRTSIPLDIHLMIENVDNYVPLFSTIGKPWVSFHPEVSYHPLRTIDLIRSSGGKPGIVIDPSEAVDKYRYLLGEVELVCVMAVNPGYSGQKLIPSSISKIVELRKFLDKNNHHALIEVDGNVSWEHIPKMLEAGADILVAGTSSLFSATGGRRENLARMERMLDDFPGQA